MGERKGFQTYISLDYDPAFLGRKKTKKKGDSRIEVRLALSFSMHCTACNEFSCKVTVLKCAFSNDVLILITIYLPSVELCLCCGRRIFSCRTRSVNLFVNLVGQTREWSESGSCATCFASPFFLSTRTSSSAWCWSSSFFLACTWQGGGTVSRTVTGRMWR